MIYRITYKKEGGKNIKLAHPVENREALMRLRDSTENLEMLERVRQGDETVKGKLLQLAYNIGYVEEEIAGCKSVGSFFFHDVDCYDQEQSARFRELILSKKDEIGLMMLEKSAGGGWHLVCRRVPHTTILENQVRVATALQIEMDTNAKDLQRVVFSTSGSEDDLVYLDDALFTEPMSKEECEAEYGLLKEREKKRLEQVPKGAKKSNKHYRPWEDATEGINPKIPESLDKNNSLEAVEADERTRFIAEGVMKAKGLEHSDFLDEGGRHTTVKIFLSGATQLLKREETDGVLAELMPDHWRDENIQQLVSDFYANYTNPSQRLTKYQETLFTQSQRLSKPKVDEAQDADDDQPTTATPLLDCRKMPKGVKDSIEAAGPDLTMPVVTAICPAIGALATGVTLDVHGKKKGLNLIAYIAGDAASNKGSIDPVIDAWMREVAALDKMYQQQEDEWRVKKRAAKNKKEQPEEPKLPVRCVTLNNTVANIAERLANTEGKHAFSFTPEADTVAQKWKSAVSDFSVMIRQSYDGSRYDREARSADAVNVHIEHLLWNVTMCGTPDALYRVVTNCTDGLQTRIALARTPDNTYSQLEDDPRDLTGQQEENIQQIAHLLPLLQGEIVLPKLEKRGREWVERIRLEAMKNDDKVLARQRFRICVTAQRMTCCLMLCKMCEGLIAKHGLNGAETQLKQNPSLWKEKLLKAQTPQLLEAYDVIADSLMENALYYFRERIENAAMNRDYVGIYGGERHRIGKNDSIYERLDMQFTFEQAMQQSVAVKGAGISHNSVKMMLKNWHKQGLVVMIENGKYSKTR